MFASTCRSPHIDLRAQITKNKTGTVIPLRAALVELLRPYVEERPAAARLFDIPVDINRRFDADCRRAGIPKIDDRGRVRSTSTALRKSFNTWLAVSGVPLTNAQRLMRHSDPKLTANAYIDARILDLAGTVRGTSADPPRIRCTDRCTNHEPI